MNRTQKRAEKASQRKLKKKAAKLVQSKSGSGQLFAVLDERVRELAKTTITLYQNQQKLAKGLDDLAAASDLLDEQFAVLSRLTIMQLNHLSMVVNNISSALMDTGPRVKPTGREDVTALFNLWREFKKRTDFREHSTAWFMGEDLSTLPPPPPPAKEELCTVNKETTPDAPQQEPGGAVFGGDYGKSDDGNPTAVETRPQDSSEDAEDSVPQVRAADQSTS